jgi:hypothetical protein
MSLQSEQSMGRALSVAFMLGLLAACTPTSLAVQGFADQGDERVLIRNGFVVPAGKLLRVDDMSVDCVIASEVFDQQEFNKVGVEATAYLRMVYPTDACPEALDSEGDCPTQDYVLGTATAHGLRALFVQPGQPNRFVLRVGAGREMHVFAAERATLFGICEGVLINIINAFIDAGSGRLITPTPP